MVLTAENTKGRSAGQEKQRRNNAVVCIWPVSTAARSYAYRIQVCIPADNCPRTRQALGRLSSFRAVYTMLASQGTQGKALPARGFHKQPGQGWMDCKVGSPQAGRRKRGQCYSQNRAAQFSFCRSEKEPVTRIPRKSASPCRQPYGKARRVSSRDQSKTKQQGIQ